MKRKRYSILITWLTCLSLLLSLCAGILVSDKASAAPKRTPQRWSRQSKVGSDLRKAMVNGAMAATKWMSFSSLTAK